MANVYLLAPKIKMKKSQVTSTLIKIYSYAFEYHQALAILTMLCKTGRTFAWNDYLDTMKQLCREDKDYVFNRLLRRTADPLIEETLATVQALGVKRSNHDDLIQIPSKEEIKGLLEK